MTSPRSELRLALTTLKRLGTDYVDLLQAHDVEFGVVRQIMDETIPAMRLIQEQGKSRNVRITGYSLRTLARIAEAVPVDIVLSISVQPDGY